MDENILSSLNNAQKEAVLHTDGPLLILAGAGSGKTKTLTHRIAYLIENKGVLGENILAVTFTNKASEEMRSRLAHLTKRSPRPFFESSFFGSSFPITGTFHSICLKILRQDINLLGREKNFHITDTSEQESYVKNIIKEVGFDAKQFSPKGFLGVISNAKNKGINSEQFARQAQNYMEEVVAKVYEKYEYALSRDNALDFDDLLLFTLTLFEKSPKILEKYQKQFRYVLVDEYQDTNAIQYRIISQLANKSRNICAVGDDWQSIYAFRGADIRNILDFEKEYPDAKIIHLEQNYRSTQIILDAAHGIISQNKDRKDKKLWTERKGGKKIIVFSAEDEAGEARFVAKSIQKSILKDKEDYKNFAVLYRTNAQSRALEETFLFEGIPYKIVGGLKFYDRKEIKDIIAYIRILFNPKDRMALLRIINEPKRGIGKKTFEAWLQYADKDSLNIFEAGLHIPSEYMTQSKRTCVKDFCTMMQDITLKEEEASLSDWVKRIYRKSGYEGMLMEKQTAENQTRKENIGELFGVLSRYDGMNIFDSVKVFLEEVALISDSDQISNDENVVHCMTMHSAKGLEFDHVFIVGMEENILPHSRSAFSLKDLEEERRLMYVGITRAKKSACLLHARQRMLFGSFQANPVSRFLDEIPEKLLKRVEQKSNPLKKSFFSNSKKNSMRQNRKTEQGADKEKKDFFRDGEKVLHAVFGSGVIVSQNEETYTIVFQKTGIKKIAKDLNVLKKT